MKIKLAIIGSLLTFTLVIVPRAMSQWVQTNGPYAQCFATIGTKLFIGSASDGVFVSDDTGTSWTQTNLDMTFDHVYIVTLAVQGKNLFAGSSRSVTSKDGSGGSVLLSTDYGANWQNTSVGLSGSVWSILANGPDLFAGTDSGLFLSNDLGSRWTSLNGLKQRPVYSIAIIGSNIFTATDTGIFMSPDYGNHWSLSYRNKTRSGGTFALIDNELFIGNHDGVLRTSDNGQNWVYAQNGFADSAYINSFESYGKNLFAATAYRGVYLTTNLGNSWKPINEGFQPISNGWISSHGIKVFGGRIFASNLGGLWTRPVSELPLSVSNRIESVIKLISFPNPFTKSTSIEFSTSDHSSAQVSIRNLLGSEVARLFTGPLDAGEHTFTWDAHGISTGMYICVIHTNGRTEQLPILLLKK
ncbi:MAG: T9SS type A sorting domain-containing protein [Bacteroidota bacterium]|nr:T9SS type A sorting domain-containing protein [Bacteroidota bacterium]MDP4230255.1 T9SS type A sorting domain-containing protein [Bacteroidota bacterium]MDP4237655.1 T9SS type A sorting domain-containing protein [Bacteroidota bacterium]